MGLKNLDPKQYSIIVGVIPISSGYADGEFITIENESDTFTDQAGTDGEVVRVKTNDDRATVTIKLMQTADANNALSALWNLDKNASNGAGVGPLTIKDRAGTTVYFAEHSWIAKPPDASLDRQATARAWKIRCADLQRLDGGN